MTKETFKVTALPTSFVHSNMKPINDKGSGEARLFLGNKGEFQNLCDFFGLDNNGKSKQQISKYNVRFDKENCLDYMKYSKIEHVFQFFNKYKNTNIDEWNSIFAYLKDLDENEFYIKLYTVNDSSRFYVRADEDIYMKCIRKIIIPRITDLIFVKDEEKKTIEIQLIFNFSYDLNNNNDTNCVDDHLTLEYCYFPNNILLYGVPGCGKSYSVDKFIENEGISRSFVRRVVFHPDYTYSDFVGQIMPITKETEEGKKIEYTFIPGPFTDILKVAYENPGQKCVLVIEELNRGNAPAIFGDLFQLLDREEDPSKDDYKWSKYHVTNKDIAENAILVRNERDYSIRIPPNLTIMATMNTSDQNVFSMDTAFQRRWQMRHIRNVFEGEHAEKLIEGTLITWKAFATTVNELLTDKSTMFGNSEDKCLGAYFAIDAEIDDRQRFAEKVLKYLWDDAFKMDRTPLFDEKYSSLSKLIEDFEDASGDALKVVLQADVYKKMLDKSHSTAEIPAVSDVSEITEQE